MQYCKEQWSYVIKRIMYLVVCDKLRQGVKDDRKQMPDKNTVQCTNKPTSGETDTTTNKI